MKQGKLNLLLATSIALVLGGCASTPPKPKPQKAVRNGSQPAIPVGYINPTGTINNKGSEPRALPVAAFSSTTDGNIPTRVMDGDLGTRWSSKGHNAWVVLDYGKLLTFDAVRMSFHKGDERSSSFEIEISKDGRTWSNVIPKGVSSSKTKGYERYPFAKTKARYIKYIGHGNTKSKWNSLTEFNAVNCEVNTCPASEFIILK